MVTIRNAAFVCVLISVAMRLPMLLLYFSPTDLLLSELLASECLFCNGCCLAREILYLNSVNLLCCEMSLLTRMEFYGCG